MKTFEYRAIDVEGAPLRGRAWASTEVELDREFEQSGITLTSVKEVGGARARGKYKLKPRDLHQITTQLATVTAAGVPLVEGIQGIGARLRDENSRLLLEEVVTDLEAGEGLSGAMERHPKAFPVVYQSSVRAGEASGALDIVLIRLAKYLEWAQTMKSTTIQALIYPTILLFAISGLIGILLYFVLPRIMKIFPGGREDLPSQTQFVLGASDLLVNHIFVFGFLAVASVAGFIMAMKKPRGREIIHGLILKVPKFGSVASQIATSKFASTACTLQAAGCDVFTMLKISGTSCGNEAMARSFDRVTDYVRNGLTIADALERENKVDPLLIQMVSVGEKTGRLDTCLNRLVEYYDDEVPRTVKRFLAFFEPMMLIVAGGVVAFILLAALMPIFNLYESL